MGVRLEKGTAWFFASVAVFVIGLGLLAIWTVSLRDKIMRSELERGRLKEKIEKIEILEKVNRNFMKDLLRQKAIALCFLELIGNYESRYGNKGKQDCIQWIVITDEKLGEKGFGAPLILAWIENASQGNPDAVSPVGGRGLTHMFDYQAWRVLNSLGYPSYDLKLILDPVVNLESGVYYMTSLMKYWEWKGVSDQSLLLFYTLHSYRFGSESTEELFTKGMKPSGPAEEYIAEILNRRDYWAARLKYWVEDAQKLAAKSK